MSVWAVVLALCGCTIVERLPDNEANEPRIWLPTAVASAAADNPNIPNTSRVAQNPVPRPKPPSALNQSVIQLASGTPEELIGLGPELTVNLLGEPSNRLEEASTRVWRYEAETCTLQLTLLLNVVTSTYQTVFYEVKPSDGVEISREACLAEVIATRRVDRGALR